MTRQRLRSGFSPSGSDYIFHSSSLSFWPTGLE